MAMRHFATSKEGVGARRLVDRLSQFGEVVAVFSGGIQALAERYIAERDLSEGYAGNVLRTAVLLDQAGGAFEYDMVNRWLASLMADRSRETVKGYKRVVVSLWNYAAELGLAEWPNTRRIKTIRSDLSPPRAFSLEEIARLLDAAGTLRGTYDWGARSDYWQSLIVGAYDLGFRRGDLFRLPRSIDDGKAFAWRECKTGRVQVRKLSGLGCELLGRLPEQIQAWPWRLNRTTTFCKTWSRISHIAGVSGPFKGLRRSHGTYAGTLGHADPRVFEKYYLDKSRRNEATGPEPLEWSSRGPVA